VEKMDAGVFPPHKEALELMGMGFMILKQATQKKEGTNLSALVQSKEQKQGIKMFLDHLLSI
jgi:hypothetical protein